MGPEVRSIDGDHGRLREQFAHPHEAQIGKIGFSIGIPVGKARQLNKVFSAVKGQCYQPFIQHRESQRRASR
jgi:hypothetical protein